MQAKSDRTKVFLDSFETYRVRSGVKIAEACRNVGISRSLFYELRSGAREVTAKMENRLADVIKDAQFSDTLAAKLGGAPTEDEKVEIFRNAPILERLAGLQVGSPSWSMEIQFAAVDLVTVVSSLAESARIFAHDAMQADRSHAPGAPQKKKIEDQARNLEDQASRAAVAVIDFVRALMVVMKRIENSTQTDPQSPPAGT